MKMIYTFLMAKAKPIAIKGEIDDNNAHNEGEKTSIAATGSPSPTKRRTVSGGSPEAFAVAATINNNYFDSFQSADLTAHHDSFLEDHDHLCEELGTQDNNEGDLVIEEVDEEQFQDEEIEIIIKKAVCKKRSKSCLAFQNID